MPMIKVNEHTKEERWPDKSYTLKVSSQRDYQAVSNWINNGIEQN